MFMQELTAELNTAKVQFIYEDAENLALTMKLSAVATVTNKCPEEMADGARGRAEGLLPSTVDLSVGVLNVFVNNKLVFSW